MRRQVIQALLREELRSGGRAWSSNHSAVSSPQETSCYYYKDEVLFFFLFIKNFLNLPFHSDSVQVCEAGRSQGSHACDIS